MFKTVKDGKLPQIQTEFSAGADCFAREDVIIGAGETKVVPLGIMIDLEQIKYIPKMTKWALDKYNNGLTDLETYESVEKNNLIEFMKSHYFKVSLRSSMSSKHGLIIANGEGVIDMDYNGEIGVIIHNPVTHESVYDFSQEKYEHYFEIKKGDRVAQIMLMKNENHLMPDSYRLNNKRDGGFGSTNQ